MSVTRVKGEVAYRKRGHDDGGRRRKHDDWSSNNSWSHKSSC